MEVLAGECRPLIGSLLPGRALAALLFPCLVVSRALTAQNVTESRWRIGVGAGIGVPSGWVEVRERAIEGTRLHFRHDLGVARDRLFDLRVEYSPRPDDGFGLGISSWTLRGAMTLPGNVTFNGTTLAAGHTLTTRTGFPDFVRIDLEGWRRLSTLGGRASLAGSLGLTAVLLTFRMSGTETPNSVGHETKEDFVTQELPVPIVGIRLRYPVGSRVALSASFSGGYLPWVNSLRREGGEVRITQGHIDMDVGADVTIAPTLHVLSGLRVSDFTQREKSREDGNDIHLSSTLLVVGVVHGF
jgi:hypothetical protein